MSAKRNFQAFVLMVQGTGVDRDAARRGTHLTLDVLPTLSPRAQIAVIELAHALRRSEKAFGSRGEREHVEASAATVARHHPCVVEPDPRD